MTGFMARRLANYVLLGLVATFRERLRVHYDLHERK